MFPDNLYVSDPTAGLTYIVENDVVATSKTFATHEDVYGYLICQNMVDVYTVNRSRGSVSRYSHLECIGDINVGNTPWAICEDPRGVIYVTNYADNTVSVIENGQVTDTISILGRGPRGIVSDANGVIYVACYLSNTVCKIVNRTVVDNIPVAYNPEGITCSPFNDVWVACSGSNSVVKLNRNGTRHTIATGKCPVAVVCDKRGNVLVANFEDDTVSIISTLDGTSRTVNVGDGPNAITVNSKNFVYVTSNLSGEKIYKINPVTGLVVDRIEVCKSQCAFGDFTGCATYNCFNPNGGGGSDSGIDSGSVENVIEALRPVAKVTTFVENADGSYTVGVSSDLLDMNAFDHIEVNGISEMNADGTFTIPAEDTSPEIQVKGYFEEDESSEDNKPINFIAIDLSNVFEVEVGIVDSNYSNYAMLSKRLVNFDVTDVSSITATQYTDGHIVLCIPTRVYNSIKDTVLVQGMQEVGTAWNMSNLSEANQILVNTAVGNDKKTILVNPWQTNNGEKWLVQVFRNV